MNASDLTIRPGKRTDDEGKRFAYFMNQASDGGFKKMFGKRFEEIVSKVYLEPNHDLSYETALFAEVAGRIVGMVSGYTAEQYQHFSKDALSRASGRSRFRISFIFALIAPMMRFLHTYDDGDYYVEFLAVDSAFGGQGIGSSLLQAIEDRAQASGATQLSIDVAARNTRAQRLYKRIGFTVIRRWPCTRWLRANILRMTKPL